MAALDQQQGNDGWDEEQNLSNTKAKGKEGGGPGEIITQPDKKIDYKAPFSQQNTYFVHLTNNTWHKIVWAHNTRLLSNLQFLKQVVEPNTGVLDRDQSVVLAVTCYPFDIEDLEPDERDNTNISFEWTNTPAGAGDIFEEAWLLNPHAVIRSKDIKVDFQN